MDQWGLEQVLKSDQRFSDVGSWQVAMSTCLMDNSMSKNLEGGWGVDGT